MPDQSISQNELSATKRLLLAKWRRGEVAQTSSISASAIPRRSPQDNVPLSFAQQRLWFLNELELARNAYILSTAVSLLGSIDIEILHSSLQEIIRRHEILRTTFVEVNEQPVQVIAPAKPVTLPFIDLRGLSRATRDTELSCLVPQYNQVPFDLTCGPLLRACLFCCSEEEHIFVLNMHHIVSDGWSLEILAQELTTLYTAFSRGGPSPLPELPIQYADYALWQRNWLEGEVMQEQISYWKQQLADLPSILTLPTDRPRSAVQTSHGAIQRFVVSQSLSAQLETWSQQEGVTLFMTLLAAFQILLYRYSRQTDIAVGVPAAGRTRAELEGLIGFFVTTLVMRTRLEKNPTVREVIQQVRQVALEGYAHQDVPFERLVEELQPARDLSYSPLFQVMLNLQSVPTAQVDGLFQVRPFEFEMKTVQFDLTLDFIQSKKGLLGSFSYNTDLFDEATICRMTNHLLVLLEDVISCTDMHVAEIPLLTAQEQQELIALAGAEVALPLGHYLSALFEEQVERAPDRIAVVCEEEQLTYHALNAYANQLAHFLHEQGVGPELHVGICLERSLEMLIALLGILKAGAVYVPLDPRHPQERLTFIIKQAMIPVVVTQQLLAEMVAPIRKKMYFDTDWQVLTSMPCSNPGVPIYATNLAYMLYTSGSTGKPKGVMVTHEALSNFLIAMQQEIAITDSDVLLAVTTLSFDIAALELYLPLLVGTRVVIAKREVVVDGLQLADAMELFGITVMQATPSTWQLLLAIEWQGRDKLKLLCGGEALPHNIAVQLRQRSDVIWNLYGPTETTIWSMACRLSSQRERVSLGQPISNTQIYILDDYYNLVPIGVPGELYIGGVGIARGYFDQADLTAERFLADPFSSLPDARFYKTGDLVRRRHDGTMEFLGRTDHQVKIRGFRIELGEIESVLRWHPSIAQVAVVVHTFQTGDTSLIGYIVPLANVRFDEDQIQDFLRQHLPDYMIPTILIPLDGLPLTPNGKLDRKALPIPTMSSTELNRDYTAIPHTPIEELLLGIWKQVLAREQIDIYDNFFAIGGHSLLAAQVIGRLQKISGASLPLRVFFEAPKIAELAQRVEKLLQVDQPPFTLPLCPISREDDLPLSFAQQRFWFLHQMEPDNPMYNISLAVCLNGKLHREAVRRALYEIMRRHETLRATFTMINGKLIQRVSHSTLPIFTVVDLIDLSSSQQEMYVKQLVQQNTVAPFDLEQGPLLRSMLIILSEKEHVFSLTMHHIVSDGWSIEIFINEFGQLYTAFSRNLPSPLPELFIQYVDYIYWQRDLFQRGGMEHHLNYWRKQFADMPPVLALPTDYPRPAIQTFQGAELRFALSTQLSQDLNMVSQREGATLFMVLLAAFQALLARYTGQFDIVVGSPVANRSFPEVEGLIGCFVNTLMLRTNFSGNPPVSEIIKKVRETTLNAYTHQELPFVQLVEVLQPERTLSYNRLYQVGFVFQNMPSGAIELPGLTLSSLAIDSQGSENELLITMVEGRQGLFGVIRYNVALFAPATIARFSSHFEAILKDFVTRPHHRLADLSFLSEAERHQIMVSWNDTKRLYPPLCFHHIFEMQAEKTPDAIAIIFHDLFITYSELNRRANQLARYLQKRGVGPEVVVGLYVERSVGMLVGLLSILKAGGAYIPLDPAYPSARLDFMLRETQVRTIVSQKSLEGMLNVDTAHVVYIDADWQVIAQESQDNLDGEVRERNLAYVIYTSGSTGKPKGVMVEHRGVCNLADAQMQAFCVSPESRIYQFASFSFDAFVSELLMTWRAGATLYLSPNAPYVLGTDLYRLLHEQCITHVTLPPSLLMNPPSFDLPMLRTVISAGEECSREVVEHWVGGRSFYNAYGPTETTVCATMGRCMPADGGERKPSIGHPITNMQVYVLDTHRHSVPIGVIGELYIGGVGLARGYWQRPEVTAQSFVPNPFSDEAGTRLYKTGDLARYRADGTIEFVGRSDSQVKLRGNRIELGELEALMRSHPAVEKAVVVVDGQSAYDKKLIAYIVPSQSSTANVEVERIEPQLQEWVRQHVPAYMVPATFVSLHALPYTPSGKVNRNNLPRPDERKARGATDTVSPKTELQRLIAQVWQEVLKIEQVNVNDNFFDLGGHSLYVPVVLSSLQSHVDVHLNNIDIFTHPTVKLLAEYIDRGKDIFPVVAQKKGQIESRSQETSQRRMLRRATQPEQGKKGV